MFTTFGSLFYDCDENILDEYLTSIFNNLNISELVEYINNRFSLVEELVNSYLEQSFGSKIFSKILFVFSAGKFEKKIKKFFFYFFKFIYYIKDWYGMK